ncbi:hypothetical protein QYF61_020146 [Mycteria americana]|uniref:Uncharacterized protein n=1 Tax=Mycteria americana TaxID=33587 RepID=A0AAN7N4W2_MYCAM|nr:hypothetical protein QYF61_020146 [Mycteria americana]
MTLMPEICSAYYDNVRPLAYPDSDAVLICFDISRPETLDSVLKKVLCGDEPGQGGLAARAEGREVLGPRDAAVVVPLWEREVPFAGGSGRNYGPDSWALAVVWQGETQEFCPNAKIVLVGCKLDMRTDLNTLRELSKQRLIPVTHEQVLCWGNTAGGGQATAGGSEGLLPGCCGHQRTQQCLQAGPETQSLWCSAGVAALWAALGLAPCRAEGVPDDCPGERGCPGPQLQGWHRVSEKVQGSALARQIGAVAYAECSSKVSENSVRDVFHVTTLASVNRVHKNLKRSNSKRGLKRASQMPGRTDLLSDTEIRKDRAKSCSIM